MNRDALSQTLQQTKRLLQWESASRSAKEWWEELESINEDRVDLVLKLAAELLTRRATIDDFFLACSYSNREGVKENLRFLDLMRQDDAGLEQGRDEQPTASDKIEPAVDDESSLLH